MQVVWSQAIGLLRQASDPPLLFRFVHNLQEVPLDQDKHADVAQLWLHNAQDPHLVEFCSDNSPLKVVTRCVVLATYDKLQSTHKPI